MSKLHRTEIIGVGIPLVILMSAVLFLPDEAMYRAVCCAGGITLGCMAELINRCVP